MPKVSVLIAVYNAEKYLHQCLNSMRLQTLHDIEVLCVDDASTDSSLSILQEFAEKDERFKVFHLEQNSGPCKARNVALKHSTGEYVCFLDADDWMNYETLQKTVDIFEHNPNTDAVLFNCRYYYEDGSTEDYSMPLLEMMTGEEAFIASLDWSIHGIYMVRGNMHRAIPYDDSDNAFNDENVTRMHYYKSREVRQSEGVYWYRMHSGSVTHDVSSKKVMYIKTCEEMKQKLNEMNCSEAVLTRYESHRWMMFVDAYMHYYKNRDTFTSEERNACISAMKSVWEGFETCRLYSSTTRKFGYMPLHFSWSLFVAQMELYFGIRKMIGRL